MPSRKRNTESVERCSADLVAEQVERLKEIFPEIVTEGKVDFERLKATLGEIVDDRPERYSFSWAGKRDAIRLLQVPSRATLKPCVEESVDWVSTKNVFIEGENLEVLKLLYKSYAGRVKMIYIDPPYNTGNDFIYPDNFADPLDTYLKLTGQKDSEGNLLTSNPETSGRYHSAWLSMMYPRLFVARQLMREDAVIFVSVDDNELHNLRNLMNEIFGEENLVAVIVVQSNKRGQTYKDISKTHEYLLLYGRNADAPIGEMEKTRGSLPYHDSKGEYDLWELRNRNPKFGRHNRPNLYFPIYVAPDELDECGHSKVSLKRSSGYHVEVLPKDSRGRESCWRWSRDKIVREDLTSETPVVIARRKRDGSWNVYERSRKTTTKAKSLWTETAVINEQGTVELGEIGLGGLFDHPKPIGLVAKCLQIATDDDGIVLDFFAGSSTTAHSVFVVNRDDLGRRQFVLVQLPELIPGDSAAREKGFNTIADIGKERIRRVIKKLKDEAKGKERDLFKERESPEDLGFRVFKLDESNYRQWRGIEERDGEKYAEEMALFADALLIGWKPEDVIWEVALKEGYSLSSTVEELKEIKGNRVWRVEDPDRGQSFRICLDDKIKEASIRALKLRKEDLFICRDAALTDEQAANLALQCRLKTI